MMGKDCLYHCKMIRYKVLDAYREVFKCEKHDTYYMVYYDENNLRCGSEKLSDEDLEKLEDEGLLTIL